MHNVCTHVCPFWAMSEGFLSVSILHRPFVAILELLLHLIFKTPFWTCLILITSSSLPYFLINSPLFISALNQFGKKFHFLKTVHIWSSLFFTEIYTFCNYLSIFLAIPTKCTVLYVYVDQLIVNVLHCTCKNWFWLIWLYSSVVVANASSVVKYSQCLCLHVM